MFDKLYPYIGINRFIFLTHIMHKFHHWYNISCPRCIIIHLSQVLELQITNILNEESIFCVRSITNLECLLSMTDCDC